MKTVLILNGPNLNMLGVREPHIYGHETLQDTEDMCHDHAKTLGFSIDFRQSNYEGELVTWIQEALQKVRGIIINAAAYTHTSIAIHDALKLHNCPIIEVHFSHPKDREKFRHISYIEPLAITTIAGKGAKGYLEALTFLENSIINNAQ